MTITSETFKNIYTCDGSTTVFPYTFRIIEDTDLEVILYTIADGTETVLTITTHYTVSGAGGAGGNVTTVSTYSSAYKLIIRRGAPYTQETDYVENDPFPAETHEEALDRLVMLAQQLKEQIDRAVLRDASQTTQVVFPVPAADKLIGWNAGGTALENEDNPAVAALAAQVAAEAAQAAAETAQTNAETAETNAETAETNAETAETNAEAAQAAAEAAAATFGVKGPDVASASNISPDTSYDYFDVTGTTNITSITIRAAGKVLRLQFDGVLTVVDGGNLKLNGNFITAAESTISLISDGTNWIELSRSPTPSTVNPFIGTFTRDVTTASGTQAITGVGFEPSVVIFLASVPTSEHSFGFDDGTNKGVIYIKTGGATNAASTSYSIFDDQGSGNTYAGVISAMGADGFTISWTKAGSPSGTLTGIFLAFR